MFRLTTVFMILFMAAGSMLLMSCELVDSVTEQDNADDGDIPDDDDDNDTSPADQTTSATPGVESAELNENHTGWKNADCGSCHLNVHQNGFERAECTSCHGANGAPERESGHSNAECASCHGQSHTGLKFNSPSDCRMCHGYEKTKDSDCPSMESFDVVVIGAGGGGLSTAAILAQNGLSVAVLEKHYKVGGCMGRFHRNGYNFEISLHALDGMEPPDGMNRKMFESLGIADKIMPVKLDPMYVSIFPEHQIVVPSDVEEYRQVLKAEFPDQAENIDRLWDDMADYDKVFSSIFNLMDEISFDDIITVVTNAGVAMDLLKLMNTTLADMLSEYTDDEQLIAVWTQLALFLGVEPNRLSALMFVVMWNNYHHQGFYYFEGGSEAVAQAMAQVVEENGSTIRTGALVTKIEIENGQATFVRTHNDGCYQARYVVSNANAIDTLTKMIEPGNLPADYLTSLDEMTLGLSPFTVYLGVDQDYGELFEGSHEIMFSETYNTDQNVDYILQGDLDNAPGAVANYSAVDPTAAPEGKSALQLISQLPYDWMDDWRWEEGHDKYVQLKTEAAWKLIERVEQHVPGLSDHIEVMEIATPRTVFGYTLNPKGSIFGWEHTIGQSLQNRLQNETPIRNLYLVGAWTNPGAGQSAVMQSGMLVSGMILEQEGK